MSSAIFIALNHRLRPLNFMHLCNSHRFSSLYKGVFCSGSLSFSEARRFSSSHSGAFMEAVKSVAGQGLKGQSSVAIRAHRKSYSYAQLMTASLKIRTLLQNGGLGSTDEASKKNGNPSIGGARIGIVAKPSAEFVAGMLGTWISGGVAVPLALSYPEAELLHVLNDSGVSTILSTEDHHDIMQNVAAKISARFSLIPPVSDVSLEMTAQDGATGTNTSLQGVVGSLDTIEDESPALIVYTSGTTGRPKGAVHTHRSIHAQVKTLSEAWEYTSADQFLHCLPLHHVHGLFNALLAPLYAGSTVEFLPKFSVSGIWQRWRESYPLNGNKSDDAITVFTGVPTMYTRLIQGYEAMDAELQAASASAARQLRLMMCGSSALPLPVMEQWEKITEHRLLERYGMTEFVMALSNPLKGMRKPGTVGKPFPGVETKILTQDDDGSNSKETGELCIKSPSLFKEYWNRPEVTKESFINGGFFKTGDAVTVDEDGYYIILGRTNADIMKVGGYKLSALEIESVLLGHAEIAECSVLGLPDKDYGEAVCAIIVLEADAARRRQEESRPSMSVEELCSWAKDKLAPYKLPKVLFVWESLPRNAMGKINKKELKKLLAAKEDSGQQ